MCCSHAYIDFTDVILQIQRVVPQLQSQPRYLFLYLDALVSRDPHLVSNFADMLVRFNIRGRAYMLKLYC